MSVQPELGLVLRGERLIIVLYLKDEPIDQHPVNPLLHLLGQTHGALGAVAILDVRRGKLFKVTRQVRDIDAFLAAEPQQPLGFTRRVSCDEVEISSEVVSITERERRKTQPWHPVGDTLHVQTWLHQQCAEFVFPPEGVYVANGQSEWPLMAADAADLTRQLEADGHLVSLPKESAALASVIEVALVDFILERIAALPGAPEVRSAATRTLKSSARSSAAASTP